MPITDVEKLKSAWIGGEQGLTDPAAAVNGLCRRTVSESAINSVAGTAVTASPIEHVRRACVVKSISILAPIAVTADASNNAVITVSKQTGAAAPVTIATTSTIVAGTGSLVANVPFTLPASAITAANTQIAAGDVLLFAVAKGGTGVALTAATSSFKVSVDLEEV